MAPLVRQILDWLTPRPPVEHFRHRGGSHSARRKPKGRGNGAHKRRSPRARSVRQRRFGSKGRRQFRNRRQPRSNARSGRTVAYHGTPSTANARSILRDGWIVGSGNALGDGVYLARDVATAKSYAGSGGVYLKCQVRSRRTCKWDAAMQRQFDKWCRSRGVRADNSARTAFLLRRRFDAVQSGNVIVVLAPQYANPSAWKRRNRSIRVLSVHRASDDRRIRV